MGRYAQETVKAILRLCLSSLVLASFLGPANAASSSATTYRVQAGDTLSTIAARAGVGVAQIRALNPELRRSDTVQMGRVIRLPLRHLPATAHTVQSGQNLTVIAEKYGLSLRALLRANPKYAGNALLKTGARLYIPARTAKARIGSSVVAEKQPVSTPTSRATSRSSSGSKVTVRTTGIRVTWLWPLPGRHSISSGYGERTLEGHQEQHYGVDITAPVGTPVQAARSGRVLESRADFARGWGWTVVLEHPDGWITRYAHLSANLVRAGELVHQGQVIGRVGNTGRSTGPHLHYGTYLRWNPRDPLALY